MREPPSVELASALRRRIEILDCCAIVYITGDSDAPTQSDERLVVIGSNDVNALIGMSMTASRISTESVFGSSLWFRGYGGANNIALLIGSVLGDIGVVKIDDDCLLHKTSYPAFGSPNTVFFGTSITGTDTPRGSSYEMAFEPSVMDLIASYCRPPAQYGSLVQRNTDDTWDNACYTITTETAQIPYAVLYDTELGFSLRGEIYYREPFLTSAGIEMRHTEEILYEHNRRRYDSALWLLQMIAGADLVYTFAAEHCGASHDSSLQLRLTRNIEFIDALAKAGIDKGVLKQAVVALEGSNTRTRFFIKRVLETQEVWPDIIRNACDGPAKEWIHSNLPLQLKR